MFKWVLALALVLALLGLGAGLWKGSSGTGGGGTGRAASCHCERWFALAAFEPCVRHQHICQFRPPADLAS